MATKNLPREALQALRAFEIAGQRTTVADISNVKESRPRTSTLVLTATFLKVQYLIAFDDTIEDDVELLADVLALDFGDLNGHFLHNPHDDSGTYGLRFKFRDTYLYELAPKKTRLDSELARRYPDLSRSTIQKYIKAGYVTVDGKPVLKPKSDVRSLDNIAMTLPAERDFSKESLPIVYIDDDVVVVNKPAGILTHSKGALNNEFTVADFFRRYTTDALDTNRPGVVHRLDRDTSGLIIGARNEKSAVHLKKQFAQRNVKKYYYAVVDGQPKQGAAIIDLPIARNPSKPSTFRVNQQGKAAITSYHVLASNGKHSLVELQPRTGRTHQLRVHMQYIGAPISGDRVYGDVNSAERLCLHAAKLEITLPSSERRIFEAPMPDLFNKMVEA